MSAADKAKRQLLGIEIPRDELAIRIGIACTGARPPAGMSATAALDQLDAMHGAIAGAPAMGASFRRAADAAVLYFHECISAGRSVQ